VATRDDLLRLEAAGLPAVVTGKAMYEGTLGFIIDPDSACDNGATESKKLL
jgi:hypothetical protein